MSLFLFFWVVYIIIGASLIPMFTRDAYKQILAKRAIDHPNEPKNNQLVALQECKRSGLGRAATWPISLPLHFSLLKIAKELEAQNKKELEAAETARILKEYEDNDPAVIAFRQLEKAEADARELEQKKKDETALMQQLNELNEKIDQLPTRLNLPKSIQQKFVEGGLTGQHYAGFYDQEEVIEVRDFGGHIVSQYNTTRSLPPISKAEADVIIEQARRDIEMIQHNVEKAKNQVLASQISQKHYEIILIQHIDALNRITARMKEVEARVAKNRL